jgi:hypothetical protein
LYSDALIRIQQRHLSVGNYGSGAVGYGSGDGTFIDLCECRSARQQDAAARDDDAIQGPEEAHSFPVSAHPGTSEKL